MFHNSARRNDFQLGLYLLVNAGRFFIAPFFNGAMKLLGPAYLRFSPPNLKFKKTLAQQGLFILNFSLPAGRACPGANKCWAMAVTDENGKVELKKGVDNEYVCYAARGEVAYSNTRRARANNKAIIDGLSVSEIVDLTLLSLEANYKSLLKKANLMRWHVSGDFYCPKWRDAVFTLTQELSQLTHYAYTKNLPLFLDIKKPDNFRLTVSWGGRYDYMINEKDFPRQAKVVADHDEAERLKLPVDVNDQLAFGPIEQPFALINH